MIPKEFMAWPAFGACLLLLAFTPSSLCKECTNTPSQLSSHTLRYELLSSKNKSQQHTLFSSYEHPSLSVDSALDSNPMFQPERDFRLRAEQELGGPVAQKFLQEISLHKVRLHEDSMYGKAQQTNMEYLMMLEVDSLLWSFRKTAGLDTPGSPLGGWEAPDMDIRGLFYRSSVF